MYYYEQDHPFPKGPYHPTCPNLPPRTRSHTLRQTPLVSSGRVNYLPSFKAEPATRTGNFNLRSSSAMELKFARNLRQLSTE